MHRFKWLAVVLAPFELWLANPFRSGKRGLPINVPRLRHLITGAFAVVFLLSATPVGLAQGAPGLNSARANAGTLGIISGGADGTYIRIAADLSNVLDNDDLRILPMI